MAIPKAIQDLLDERKAEYTHTVHPPAFTAKQLASAEHVPEREVAKTVVFLGDGCYAMAVLPANERVDLQQLRSALGLAKVRLATETELGQLFPDCELGAMPPFGNLYGLPVYVDERLTAEEHIEFDAGTHFDVLHMRYAEFERLVKPVMAKFGEFATA